MDQRRGALHGLDQVGLDGILEHGGHGAADLEIPDVRRLVVARKPHQDAPQTLLQIADVFRKRQHGHHLGGGRNQHLVLARIPVLGSSEADDNVAQAAVVHIHGAIPQDAARIEAQVVGKVHVVADHRRQEVVGRRHRMDVTGKVQVDILHGQNLRITPARGAAFYSENRTQRRFAQGDDRSMAQAVQAHGEADRSSGFPLAVSGRRDGRHHDEFPVGSGFETFQQGQVNLALETPAGGKLAFEYTQAFPQ